METSRWEYLRLANKLSFEGHNVTERELDILLLCYENPLTPKEILATTKWSRGPVYDTINNLTDIGFLQKSNLKSGNGFYYTTAINLDEMKGEDFGKLRLKLKTASVSIQQWSQELLPGLPQAEYLLRRAFSEAIQYLWYKSVHKGDPNKLPGPTGSEIKTFMTNIIKDLEIMVGVYKQALEMNIFDETKAVHRLMGDFRDPDKAVSNFINRWEEGAYRHGGLHPELRMTREDWKELLGEDK